MGIAIKIKCPSCGQEILINADFLIEAKLLEVRDIEIRKTPKTEIAS